MTPIALSFTRAGLISMAFLAGLSAANASTTYLFDYSGAPLGNRAEAHGSMTLGGNLANPADETLLFADTDITALFLTVSGAGSGNGAFDLSSFDYFSWNTKGAALDLSRNLIGQITVGGLHWGAEEGAGGFGLGATAGSGAPASLQWYRLAASEGVGDQMVLTSFRSAAVPVPGAIWLFATAAFSLMAASRRRRRLFSLEAH